MIYNEELFGSNILNFTYDVFDISNDEKFNKENLVISKNVESAIFLLEKRGDALDFLEKMKVISLYSKYISQIEINAIKTWIENNIDKQISDSAINILQASKMEVEIMIARAGFILEDMKDKAKEEVREEEKLAIARNMKNLGLNIDIIIEATGLTKEEIIDKLNIKE